MPSLYNRVAGKSIERLAALSDRIFAVAMTLLVLDLRVPASEAVHSEGDLGRVLLALAPRLTIFLMSMMTLGIFWVGQQTQLNHFARSDRNLAWIHMHFCAPSVWFRSQPRCWRSSSIIRWRCWFTGSIFCCSE